MPHTYEDHHIIPQAWQHSTAPISTFDPQLVERQPDGLVLWDKRTIRLCPTGHRNVHFYLVLFMHDIAADRPSDERTWFAVKRQKFKRPTQQQLVALLGMQRYLDSDNSLIALTTRGLYGEA